MTRAKKAATDFVIVLLQPFPAENVSAFQKLKIKSIDVAQSNLLKAATTTKGKERRKEHKSRATTG
jgi:hypothetical protein